MSKIVGIMSESRCRPRIGQSLFFISLGIHYLCICKRYAKQKMRRIILTTIIAFSVILSLNAQETYFQYPQVPHDLTSLQERTTYLVAHFWERCDMKSAFSSRDKFKKAFSDYVSFMPYADTDTIRTSVSALIDTVKKSPNNLLILGQIAEDTLYGDSAIIWSDELYLPFAQAVVASKKVSDADKARFQHHVKVLSHSQIGMTIPKIKTYSQNGRNVSIDTISAPITILFINEPDCDDCLLAKARLSANIKANQLISERKLAIVSLYPDEADENWFKAAAGYPANWIVTASPDADSYFDLRVTPSIYIINSDKRIIAKNMDIDSVLTYISAY